MARRQPRPDPYLSQATLEASLQVDPQIAALSALLAGKRSDYINTRQVNASNTRGIKQAIVEAAPQIQRMYGGTPQAPAQGSILASLMAAGDSPDIQAARHRIVEEQGRTLADLQKQSVTAESARQYGNQQAREQYMGAKRQIQDSYQDLLAQRGQLTAATYGKLLEGRRQRGVQYSQQRASKESAAASRAQSERNSIRSSGFDPDTGQPLPKDPAKKPRPRRGLGSLTQQQESKIVNQVDEAREWVKNLNANMDQHQIGNALVSGTTLRDANGNEIKVPKLPKTVVSIALDLELPERGQAISDKNIKRAHDQLGIHIPREWIKDRRTVRKRSAIAQAVDAIGQITR